MTLAFDPIAFARALINIDSTTGREAEAGTWLAGELRGLGYTVVEQPLDRGCANVIATLDPPGGRLLHALRLRAAVLSEPRGAWPALRAGRVRCEGHSGGAGGRRRAPARRAASAGSACCSSRRRARQRWGGRRRTRWRRGSRFLINGEPTDNRLGPATRGVLRLRLRAAGRAAHSATPEHGESAIDKLIDALVALRSIPLPSDPELGTTFYSVGLIEGGIAPNVISPHASAEVCLPDHRAAEDVLRCDPAARTGS